MKTAMQELIELLELDEKHKEALPYLIDVIKEVYVSKEKEQIMNAYLNGESNGLDHTGSHDWLRSKRSDAAEYYNHRYNQNK